MPSGTLATAAEDRKSRLAALKNLKRKQPDPSPTEASDLPPPPKSPKLDHHDDDDTPPDPSSTAPPLPTTAPSTTPTYLSGRNYDPETRGPKLGFETNPSALSSNPSGTLETRAQTLAAETRATALALAAETEKLDLFTLQPKKPNWDLKRDLERKLDVLNVRTENAVARLVRGRIAAKMAERRGQGGKKGGEGEEEMEVGMDGNVFVEATREREREDVEDARRERELDEELLDGS